MARINLLPWREELRRRRQKEFVVLIVVAIIAMVGVVGGVHWEFNNRIQFQTGRNNYLLEQIAVLDKKIKQIKDIEAEKRDLLARMEIIEQLQSSRPEVVHLFDELVATLPEGVYYTVIQQKGANISVQGIAQSNARVSSFMRNVDRSTWLEKPNLVEIRKLKSGEGEPPRFSQFSLQFSQFKPKDGEEDENSS